MPPRTMSPAEHIPGCTSFCGQWAVFVVDKAGTVRYIQIVGELTHEPDYEAALDAARALL